MKDEMAAPFILFSLDRAFRSMKHSIRQRLFRRSLSILQATMTTLSFFLFTPAICHSKSDAPDATKPYLRFEGTNAPGGSYALGWGLPKHPDIWANVCEFEGQHPAGQELNDEDQKRADEVFQSVDAVAEDLENYIVDVRAGKIIHKLTILMPRFETMRTSFVIRAVADFVFR